MDSSIYLAALFLITYFLSSAPVAVSQPGALVALWRTDLRAAIRSEPLPLVFGGRIEAKSSQPIMSLWFTDNNTIVATFLIRESQVNPEPPRRDNENLPLRLRAVFLDVGNGQIAAARDWPSLSTVARIVAAENGKFVTQRGNKLTLYGSDLQSLKEINLPPPSRSEGEWHAENTSPTGRSILVRLMVPAGRLESWVWVETDTLQITHSWEAQPRGAIVSITDDRIVRYGSCDCAQEKLEIRGLSTDWTTIGPSQIRPIFFVNDDVFFMLASPLVAGDPARLVRSDGKILFTDKQPSRGGVSWRRVVAAAGGKRFVAAGVREEGGIPVFDVSGHSLLKSVLVYDLSTKEHLHVLDVKGPKIKDAMELALSPDGSRLAILNDETVQVFELPPLQ